MENFMSARIYQPTRNAMQSGQGKSTKWILEFLPSEARKVDPLMGWTSSGDMDSQVKLTFESKEEAISYADQKGITYSVQEPKQRKHVIRNGGYGDNFSTFRKETWTH
jgi:NADH dehydrogenase|tara:strand:+ start:8905 stop:9228 length:324 start_codon:yes stop_codon:yes gene_type:complete